MKKPSNGGAHRHTEAEEQRIREESLDETIEASFPASDPPSTDPNPDGEDAVDGDVVDEEDDASGDAG